MARKTCLPRSAIFIASVLGIYLAFDYSAFWCREKKFADSPFWPHRMWVGRARPSLLQRALCSKVDLLSQVYQHVCSSNNTTNSTLVRQDEWPTPCDVVDRLRVSVSFWRAMPYDNPFAYAFWEGGRKIYGFLTDAFRHLFLADSDTSCPKDCPEGDLLDKTFRNLYFSLYGEQDFFGYDIECSCDLFEDAGYRQMKHHFKTAIYGAAAFVIFIGFMVCAVLAWPIEGPKVKCTSLAKAVVAKFRALKLLKTNGNMSVFLMQHRQSGDWAYVKCLRSECSRATRREFVSELLALRVVKHPNIVRMLEWSRVGCRYSIGLESASHGGLDSIIQSRRDSYSLAEKRSIYIQLIKAVAWVHSITWVHLNIRAGSVLVFDKWSKVKLSGFSRAMRMPKSGMSTVYDLHPSCCSPRVLKRKPYDPISADVWALRSLFLFISTGQQVRPGLEGEAPLSLDLSPEWANLSYTEKLFKTMAEFFANDSRFDCSFLSSIID